MTHLPRFLTFTLTLALAFTFGACGDNLAPTGSGTLDIAVYGESFVEDGIPADEFADGWSIRFDSFLIALGDVRARAAGEPTPAVEDPTYRIFDLARQSGGQGFSVRSDQVLDGVYDDLAYRIAGSQQAIAGNASPEDVASMNQGGHAIYVVGTATQGERSKAFAWHFDAPTSYQRCRSNAIIDGAASPAQDSSDQAGSRATSTITIHADHLFYDDLISSEPALRFDAIADADTNDDDLVTMDELAAVDITGFEYYQVGSLPVSDLWTFLEYQAATLGHIDGEGHCDQIERQ